MNRLDYLPPTGQCVLSVRWCRRQLCLTENFLLHAMFVIVRSIQRNRPLSATQVSFATACGCWPSWLSLTVTSCLWCGWGNVWLWTGSNGLQMLHHDWKGKHNSHWLEGISFLEMWCGWPWMALWGMSPRPSPLPPESNLHVKRL
jgi:hypothetical protein